MSSVLAPTFSIIIPTWSRPDQLAECLRALSLVEYPRDRFEVIVVDDGGDVPLDDVLAPFRADLRLSLMRQPNAGPAEARNAGAQRAGGEYLAFTDDDCLPESGWLKELAEALAAAPECMIGGAIIDAGASLYSATSQLIADAVYRHYNANPLRARFVSSNNLAVPARGFQEIGGFDPAFRTAEDRDLCDRWLHEGRRIVYHAGARVRHARVMGAWSFCRQHFGYGRGAERFNRLRALRGSGSMVAEFRFHVDLRNWLWLPLISVPRTRVVPVAALLALWQTTNLAGFLWEKARHGTSRIRNGSLSFSE